MGDRAEDRAVRRSADHAEGRAAGPAEGRAAGHAEGRAAGHAEGRAADHAATRSSVVADLRRRLDGLGVGVRPGMPDPRQFPAPVPPIGGADAQKRRESEGAGTGGGVLAAPAPLADVLPRGGIPLGSVVGLASAAPGGSGATSLLLSLLAAPRGIWVAVVGMPDLGVLAAAEMGVDLDRLGLIPDPGSDVLQVLSVLADGVDVIATVPPANLPPARQRVLTGRLRQRGTVLLVMGRWPGADLTLTVREVRWSGIGQGHGRLRDREIDVQVGGRRAGAGATATLLLRSTRTAVTVEAGSSAEQRDAIVSMAGAGTG